MLLTFDYDFYLSWLYQNTVITSTPWSWSMLRLAVVVGWRVTDDRS